MHTTPTTDLEALGAGLRQPLPEIPSKYLYDDRGSELFDAITELPEYYPTRTEELILEAHAGDIIDHVKPENLAELGSGVGRKIRMLLDTMRDRGLMKRCALFDINEFVVAQSVAALETLYPKLEATGIVGDFEDDLALLGPGGRRLILFLAGTIGNLQPSTVPTFFSSVAKQMVPGDGFLVGVDLVKDVARIEAAYNDAAGVTAEFNRNVLQSVNNRFDATFDVDAFDHRAFFDTDKNWIEMRLVANRATTATVPELDLELAFAPGDEIRTEISCKYSRASFEGRLSGTGLSIDRWFTDPDALFALVLLGRA